jgi:hypothetical protein
MEVFDPHPHGTELSTDLVTCLQHLGTNHIENTALLFFFSCLLLRESVSRNFVQTGSGVHPTSYPMGTGGSFPGVKRPEREADHLSQTSAEVKKT